MKTFLSILLFFNFLTTARGQISFTSPITQYWPDLFSTDYLEINRTIWIANDEITILSKTEHGKEIETLEIIAFKHIEDEIVFKCLNRIGKPVTMILPYKDSFSTIDLYKISERTGEEIQVRYHLDGIVNHSEIPL